MLCRTTYFCILVSMIGLHVASQFSGVHGPNKMQINELVFKFVPTEKKKFNWLKPPSDSLVCLVQIKTSNFQKMLKH